MHLIFQTRKLYIIFSHIPPDQPVSQLPIPCNEMSLVRTGHMKMMSQAGNIAGGKKTS